MKTIILNGSPRKNWNTAQLLKEAQKGAESVGDEVEYIDLYDLNYNGCRSCLACKRKGIAEPCKCYWKDDLELVLEKIRNVNRLITGTPIYFSEPTGGFRSFMERLIFPAMSYSTYGSIFDGSIDVDVFLTMNANEQFYKQGYQRRFEESMGLFRYLNGRVRLIPVYDTLQVKDYSRYEMAGFSESHKKAVHETEFPAALEKAYDIGAGKL